jgi:hypothetical protein
MQGPSDPYSKPRIESKPHPPLIHTPHILSKPQAHKAIGMNTQSQVSKAAQDQNGLKTNTASTIYEKLQANMASQVHTKP